MTDNPLSEVFKTEKFSPRLRWINEPPRWCVDSQRGVLQLETAAGTDFWQRTHYGFQADNGHILVMKATGDFCLATKVTSRPAHQYDQAGLMLRFSPDCWLKTSVEFEPDQPNRLGVVVTNHGYSDWSTQSIDKSISTLWLRVRLESMDAIVESSLDGQNWDQLRIAPLLEQPGAQGLECGLYACSPKGAGFVAEFEFLEFQPGRLGH